MPKDARFEVIVEKLLDAFPGLTEAVATTFLHETETHGLVQAFLDGKEPHKLLFTYMSPDASKPNENRVLGLEVSDKKLKISGKALYIIRKKAEPVPQKDCHLSLISGLLDQNSLDTFHAVLQDVYLPILKQVQKDSADGGEAFLKEFIATTEKFTETFGDAISSKTSTLHLTVPNAAMLVNAKLAKDNANDAKTISYCEGMQFAVYSSFGSSIIESSVRH